MRNQIKYDHHFLLFQFHFYFISFWWEIFSRSWFDSRLPRALKRFSWCWFSLLLLWLLLFLFIFYDRFSWCFFFGFFFFLFFSQKFQSISSFHFLFSLLFFFIFFDLTTIPNLSSGWRTFISVIMLSLRCRCDRSSGSSDRKTSLCEEPREFNKSFFYFWFFSFFLSFFLFRKTDF